MRRFLFLLVPAALVFTTSPFLSADSVGVSGNAHEGAGNLDLSVTAGVLSAFWTAPADTGPSDLGFATVGVPMTLSRGMGGIVGPGFSSATIGSQFTDVVDTSFSFTSSLFTVSALVLANGTITIPVTLSGGVQAFRNLTPGQGSFEVGPLMAGLKPVK